MDLEVRLHEYYNLYSYCKMAFFNFIETFFFISLGITFVLILLLVYHFKQRMTGLEQKCDTMFEIINDMVKEMNMLRLQNTVQTPSFFQPMRNFSPHFDASEFLNSRTNVSEENKVDNESEESSNVGNSSDEEEDDGDDKDECDDEDDNEVQEQDSNDDIKLINVNQETLEELDVENLSSIDENQENNSESEEEDEHNDDEPVNEEASFPEPILVEKIEPIELESSETQESSQKESEKEVYKKMSLGALKALVISKGLCSDARTMRKPELLRLLESSDE
jgi:hypothetical protein